MRLFENKLNTAAGALSLDLKFKLLNNDTLDISTAHSEYKSSQLFTFYTFSLSFSQRPIYGHL